MTSNNPFLKLFILIDKFISDNIIDINQTRANNEDPKQRRWLYPEYPEKNDENYPRIAIQFKTPKFEDFSADNYLGYTNDGNDEIASDNYGFLATIPISLTLFIKKDQVHYISYNDGTIHPIRNTKQADLLAGEIMTKLKMKYGYFANNDVTLSKDITSTGTYEDNDFLWSVEISFNAQLVVDYYTKYDSAGIIRYINESIEVYA